MIDSTWIKRLQRLAVSAKSSRARIHAIVLGCCLVFGASLSLAQSSPKYPTCPTASHNCNEDLGHDVFNPNTRYGCTKWCTGGPLHMSPDPIESCEGEEIQQINVWLEGRSLETQGNRIDNQGALVNWDESPSDEPIFTQAPPYQQKLKHTYNTAKTYYPSATFAQQFAYTGNGSCGYRCRVQVADIAIVYLKSSPECATGKFKRTGNSEERKDAEIEKFLDRLRAKEMEEMADSLKIMKKDTQKK